MSYIGQKQLSDEEGSQLKGESSNTIKDHLLLPQRQRLYHIHHRVWLRSGAFPQSLE
jgi:hypothetical protein